MGNFARNIGSIEKPTIEDIDWDATIYLRLRERDTHKIKLLGETAFLDHLPSRNDRSIQLINEWVRNRLFNLLREDCLLRTRGERERENILEGQTARWAFIVRTPI